MKISTEIGSISKLVGEEKAVQYVAEAGFDAWDFSMFAMCYCEGGGRESVMCPADHPLSGREYLSFARKLKRIGLDYGITCNQSHAPFPSYAKGALPFLQRAIECTAEAGGKICIIHPDNNVPASENAKMYEKLLPFAKEHGVKIATENMWNWAAGEERSCIAACSTTEDYLAHMKAVNDPYFVACLDIGHAEMEGSGSGAPAMIRGLGEHLQALHIHDNDRIHDSHQLPFAMAIDFEEIVKALQEIKYQGYFTLEADAYLRTHNYEKDTAFAGVKCMAEAAKKLEDMFYDRNEKGII